jgi:hypothetical protein
LEEEEKVEIEKEKKEAKEKALRDVPIIAVAAPVPVHTNVVLPNKLRGSTPRTPGASAKPSVKWMHTWDGMLSLHYQQCICIMRCHSFA